MGWLFGIDAIAHESAIKAGGKTIAVLPSGLENIYPSKNRFLYERILDSGGTIITEYPPEVKAEYCRFLERNRIVSGLSMGTLVIEAEHRSGTSVTANFAFQQGRDVYCIPGNVDSPKSIGTNNLIKKGARLVTLPEDILNNYEFLNKAEIFEQKMSLNCTNDLDGLNVRDEYRNVYKVIKEKPIDINEIAKLSKESLSTSMAKLTMLELEGKIKRVSGNRYIRNFDK